MPLRNIVAIALAILFSAACYLAAPKSRYANLFAEALDVAYEDALENVESRELFDAAVNGMLDKLDKHSEYYSGKRFTAVEEDLQQQFGGVGMYVGVDPKTDELVVVAAMPNTPAAKAGLQTGDAIISIDGEPTLGRSREDAVEMMRGPKGKPVRLEVRQEGRMREVVLIRDTIQVDSVHGDWLNPDGNWDFFLKSNPRIGYVRISSFGDRTDSELKAAFEAIQGKVDSLILDLRMNPGGLLTSAVNTCSMLLPPGLSVVRLEGRNKRFDELHTTSGEPIIAASVPLVILIDRHSASASEIVAACLQDHGRATIIGERSYGKGTVQNIIPLERGRSAIKLTTAEYKRPVEEDETSDQEQDIDRDRAESKGRKVWGVNPAPEFMLELSEEEIFEQFRQRSLRDLAGLRLEMSQSTLGPGPANEETSTSADGSSTTDEPFVDRVLEKALAFLREKS